MTSEGAVKRVKRDEPFAKVHQWLEEAKASELNDYNGMALATADADGLPNVRMVLLKDIDGDDHPLRGFVFYTNLSSAKGRELQSSMKAALLFHWKSLERQVRIRGVVTSVSDEAADAYFASRDRGSRIGAWASDQSRPLESKFALEKRVAAVTAKYGAGEIPRPPHWSGFRVTPLEIEFWRSGRFRLHDRVVYRRGNVEEEWVVSRLYP